MTLKFDEEKQNKKLSELNQREEEDLAQIIAQRNDLRYENLTLTPINMDALRVIPEAEARESMTAGIGLVGKKLKIGIASPSHPKLDAEIKKLTAQGYDCTLVVVSPTSLRKAWLRYSDLSFSTETKAGALDISSKDIEAYMARVKNTEDVKRLAEEMVQSKVKIQISKVLEIILSGALATKASDIHIEPEDTYSRLRYRLDGVLTDITNIDKSTHSLLLSRIKLLSGLKLNIKNEAQDGRFSIKIGSDDIEIRTSILPGAYNESLVLRILNPNSIKVPLEDLGINEKMYEVIMKEIGKPNGMILTTGPTGSGKTTTLYAFIRKIHAPGVKIITIEDPIEYHLPGIVQTQVSQNEDYTFLSGLRSSLRQDPDVIMIGEIRDEETAEVAINSALTGHLVFSTLHTNSAAGTYPRLIDLGVNPKIISSAINLSIAQRLLRKLCVHCKKERALRDDEKKLVVGVLSGIYDKSLIGNLSMDRVFDPQGCEKCNHTGYSGRIGIYEGILSDSVLEKVIVTSPSEREVREATKSQGILSMKEDGIIKLLQGITTLSELGRVIDLSDI